MLRYFIYQMTSRRLFLLIVFALVMIVSGGNFFFLLFLKGCLFLGNTCILNALHFIGFDFNQSLENGVPILFWAAQVVDRDCFVFLIDHGCDPDFRIKDGSTLLHWEIGWNLAEKKTAGRKEIIQILIERVRNLNVKESAHGRTPLHCAVHPFADLEVIQQLLVKGADPRIVDFYGKSPLEEARAMGRKDIVDLLLLQQKTK